MWPCGLWTVTRGYKGLNNYGMLLLTEKWITLNVPVVYIGREKWFWCGLHPYRGYIKSILPLRSGTWSQHLAGVVWRSPPPLQPPPLCWSCVRRPWQDWWAECRWCTGWSTAGSSLWRRTMLWMRCPISCFFLTKQEVISFKCYKKPLQASSVADPDSNPDPSYPNFFGPPGSGYGSISQRHGSGSFYLQAKIVRKALIPTVLRLLFDFLSLKNYVNVPSKSTVISSKSFLNN